MSKGVEESCGELVFANKGLRATEKASSSMVIVNRKGADPFNAWFAKVFIVISAEVGKGC